MQKMNIPATPPPPPASSKPHKMVNKQKSDTENNRSMLLGDIHKGIHLKSTKHLMNDRSDPLVLQNDKMKLPAMLILSKPNSAPLSKINNSNYNHTQNNGFDLNLELKKTLYRDSKFLNMPKQVVPKSVHNMSPSSFITNNSVQNQKVAVAKPPILTPKPKLVPNSYFIDSKSKLDSSPTNIIARKFSVDSIATNLENSNKIKLSVSNNFSISNVLNAHEKAEQSFDENVKNAFKRNRSIVSSLFENNSTSSTIVNSNRQSVYLERRNSEEVSVLPNKMHISNSNLETLKNDYQKNQDLYGTYRKTPRKNTPVSSSCNDNINNITNRFDNALEINTQNFPNLPKPPHLPMKRSFHGLNNCNAPTAPQETNECYNASGFESRFRFHSESDFPKPQFVVFKKYYPSKNPNNPINQGLRTSQSGSQISKSLPHRKLVTTV